MRFLPSELGYQLVLELFRSCLDHLCNTLNIGCIKLLQCVPKLSIVLCQLKIFKKTLTLIKTFEETTHGDMRWRPFEGSHDYRNKAINHTRNENRRRRNLPAGGGRASKTQNWRINMLTFHSTSQPSKSKRPFLLESIVWKILDTTLYFAIKVKFFSLSGFPTSRHR